MTKGPSPKSDAMRALREERYDARQRQLREAQAAAQAEKPKPVKRRKDKS